MCVNWLSIGSDNGLSPIRRQAITWTIAWLCSSEIQIEMQNISFTEMQLNIPSSERWPFCPGGDELILLCIPLLKLLPLGDSANANTRRA